MPEDIVVENNRKYKMVCEEYPGGAAVEGGKLCLVQLAKEKPSG